ncbi:MAG: hypothetical protein ACLR4W_12210 [Oscillospiraceae bacterium]
MGKDRPHPDGRLQRHDRRARGKGNCRIQAGSYTGTWTWGEDGKNTIACSGVPLLLCVLAAAGEGVLLAAGNVARGQLLLGGSNYTMNMTWNSGSVQWYFNGNHT